MKKKYQKIQLARERLSFEREKFLASQKERRITLINMRCALGGRFVLEMPHDYTKKDLLKVSDTLFKILPVTTKLYKEIHWES